MQTDVEVQMYLLDICYINTIISIQRKLLYLDCNFNFYNYFLFLYFF